MSSIDLDRLQQAATNVSPPAVEPDKVPSGRAAVEQAAAGYAHALNKVSAALHADQVADWKRRQNSYAAEIDRLEIGCGIADPSAMEQLRAETEWGEMKARRFAEFNGTAQVGYGRIQELLMTLRSDMRRIAANTTNLREAATGRIEILNLVAAAVEEINDLTQRILDEHGPKTSVHDFLAAHNFDTAVPPY